MRQPHVLRSYEFENPTPLRVEIHAQDCRCCHCRPALSQRAIAGWCIAGVLVGHLIAFAIDPAGMLDVLQTMVRL
jgi:hypothetical protein